MALKHCETHDVLEGCCYCRVLQPPKYTTGPDIAMRARVRYHNNTCPWPDKDCDCPTGPEITFNIGEMKPRTAPQLPTDSQARKDIPMYSGLRAYFPLALAAIAKHSKDSNDKHNPGEPLHWSREKSSDHLDCIDRHLTDHALAVARGDKQAALAELRAIAWRALAQLELELELELDEEAACV